MTHEEAIAIIRKEYLCVDRDCDIERSCGKCDLMMPSKEPILQAYKMAIQALEQEPCEDAISRQAAIDAANKVIKRDTSGNNDVVNAMIAWSAYIKSLPSVNPQETKWIPVSERLPEDTESVLVYAERNAYDDKGKFRKKVIDIGWQVDGGWHIDGCNGVDGIAWMPLPMPYKKGGEADG